jgi:hypothetical protein
MPQKNREKTGSGNKEGAKDRGSAMRHGSEDNKSRTANPGHMAKGKDKKTADHGKKSSGKSTEKMGSMKNKEDEMDEE